MTTTLRRGGSMTAFTWTGNIAANEEMDLARLVIAGALIAAEIDRRDRAAKRRTQGGGA